MFQTIKKTLLLSFANPYTALLAVDFLTLLKTYIMKFFIVFLFMLSFPASAQFNLNRTNGPPVVFEKITIIDGTGSELETVKKTIFFKIPVTD